jgi:Pyridoxamine 5'-phosphate oxidase
VIAIPAAARALLREATLCYLAARAPGGPHVTPVVFVLDGSRLWATTARGTVKAAAWRRDPKAAGLIRVGDRAVTFRGHAVLYDALDPSTWPASMLRGPSLARASTRFTMKNARFFAGYARDAHRVPFSWSPAGRIVVSIDLEAGAVLDEANGTVEERWGPWGGRIETRSAFRRTRGVRGLESRAPAEVRQALDSAGPGVLGFETRRGPVLFPARWTRSEGAHYAAVARRFLSLSGVPAEGRGALVLDRASSWRASRMRGMLLRGQAQLFDPRRVHTGREALMARVAKAGDLPPDPVVVRLLPRSAVWWLGWSSGTVRRR